MAALNSKPVSSRVWNGCPPLEHECIMEDNGDHPLLEDRTPAYSSTVVQQAFNTWFELDRVNPFKQVCQFYHRIEKLRSRPSTPTVSLLDCDEASSMSSEELGSRTSSSSSDSSEKSSGITVVPLKVIPLHGHPDESKSCANTAFQVQWHCCGLHEFIHHCPYIWTKSN